MYQKPTNLKGLVKLVEQPDRPVRTSGLGSPYYTGTQSTEREKCEQRQDKRGREGKC
jgi:hypothetical protein